MVPTSVTREALLASLEPFFELLGTTNAHVYSVPAVQIGTHSIVFVAVPETTTATDRPAGVPTLSHPQGIDHGELVCIVEVAIVDE